MSDNIFYYLRDYAYGFKQSTFPNSPAYLHLGNLVVDFVDYLQKRGTEQMKNVFKFGESVNFERIKGLCDICTIDGSVITGIKIDYNINRPYISTILTIWTKRLKEQSK